MVRRLIRLGIIAWVVGAVAQRARRSGALGRLVPDRIAHHRASGDGAKRARGHGGKRPSGGHGSSDTARKKLAATAANEKASSSTGSKGATAPAQTASGGDDLKVIEGIGPKIETVFHEAGMTSFAKLAEMEQEAIETILRDAGVRASPGTWPQQARLAADGEWDALAELQAHLKGGREVTTD